AAESLGWNGRMVSASPAPRLFSGAMGGRAFPEEFRVGAPNVICIQRESARELVLLRQAISDLADTWRENGRDLLHGFLEGQPGSPLPCLCEAIRIGRHPVNTSWAGFRDAPLEEFIRTNHHLVVN